MSKCQTKQEKREDKTRKIRIKQKKGATLAGQVLHTKTAKKYRGQAKKMVK